MYFFSIPSGELKDFRALLHCDSGHLRRTEAVGNFQHVGLISHNGLLLGDIR